MDRRHQNPGRPKSLAPLRVRINTTVAPRTAEKLAEVPARKRGRLIDTWAELARKESSR